MKCQKAKRWMSERIDGTLGARRSASLEEHLARCRACTKYSEDLRLIASEAQKLNQVSPSDEVWLEIQNRIKAEAPSGVESSSRKRSLLELLFPSPRLRYALVSALLLAILTGGVVIGIRPWKHGDSDSQTHSKQYALSKLEEAEHHYRQAAKALWEAVSSQEKELDPETARIFQTNLEVINTSIASCKQAVLQNPDDIGARNFLLASYREKVNLLDEMLTFSSSSYQRQELGKTL